MRRTVGIILISFSLSGLWGQFWHALGLGHPPGHQITPSCDGGGGANPDGCPGH